MNKISSNILGGLILAVSAFCAFAQDPTLTAAAGDKYMISAKAGGVNFVEGTVAIVRKRGGGGRLLKGDTVEIGDRVSTGGDGRAEILLNPGSYVRLGGNSGFEFVTTSLDDLQLKLDRGTAILEVFAGDDFFVTVAAPNAKFKLINSGVFRLDVAEDGAGTLSVWKGRAQVGKTENGIIKAGRTMTVSGSTVTAAKLEREVADSFDLWSKERGKQLAKVANSLQKRDLRQVLMSSFNGRQWNMYDSFGVWVYDRFSGTNCFLPFGYGWYSPYGYGYDRYMGSYNLPPTVYNPPVSGNTPTSGQTHPHSPPDGRHPTPPFVKIRGGLGAGREAVDTRGYGNENNSPTVFAPPTYSPPASSPATARPTRSEPPSSILRKDDN